MRNFAKDDSRTFETPYKKANEKIYLLTLPVAASIIRRID